MTDSGRGGRYTGTPGILVIKEGELIPGIWLDDALRGQGLCGRDPDT